MVHDIDRAFIYVRTRIPSFYAGAGRVARGRTIGSRQDRLEEKATPPPNMPPARERHCDGADMRKQVRCR